MSNNPPPNRFKLGDVVWVKLRTMWWPGVVVNEEHLPDGSIRPSNNRPIAIVRFFGERTFEIVRHANQILPYNCPKKYDFIFKGLVLFRKDHDYAIKFPSDVQLAEKRTGGDVNMFDRDDEFTLAPIEEKTAKSLALQRKERGDPQPGEGEQEEECPHSDEHIRVQLESSKLTELLEYECTCRKQKKLKPGDKCSDCNHPPKERAVIAESMKGNEDFELAYYNLKLTYLKNEIRAMQLSLRKKMDPTSRQQLDASIIAYHKALRRHEERYAHLRVKEPIPSTSKEPIPRRSVSYEHLSSRRSPSPSPSSSEEFTSEESMSPLSREEMPIFYGEALPDMTQSMSSVNEPIPSTSRRPITSCLMHPIPSTSRGPMSSSSIDPIPSTSRGPISSSSKEPIPSTSKGPIPSTSRQLVPLREPLPPYRNTVRDPYYVCPKTLSGISLSFLYVPLVREIPWTVPVITKKRGRKKIIRPPPPGKSKFKGQSYTHILDIYRDVADRIEEENRRFEDPSIPLPLYLRPESVWPVEKVYPNWRENIEPSNKLHPIPAKEGEYKCHLCKFSCNRQNNIVIHIKLHNYGKSLEDMARRVYVNYVKRLILDESETIAVVDSDDEQEESIAPPRDPDCTFTDYTINCEDLSSNDSFVTSDSRKNKEQQSSSTDVLQIYRNKKPLENTNLQLIKTKAQINVEGRQSTPSPSPSDTTIPVNKDLPSTSKAAAAAVNKDLPSTSKAAAAAVNKDLPSTSKAAAAPAVNKDLPSTSKAAATAAAAVSSGSDVTSISSDESDEDDPIVIMGPTKRTRIPPRPAVDIPLRRAVCLRDPIVYIPPWKQPPPTHPNILLRGAIVNPLHYLPPKPKLVIPEPKIIISRKKRLQQRPSQRQQRQQLQEPARSEQSQRQQQPSGSKRRYDNVRKKIIKTTTRKQTDNENVREILRDWDDDDDTTTSTNNNPIPSTSRQNIDSDNDRNISDDQQQQHPIRLEDAVSMLRQLHTTDDDAELNSPARKIRNIPKKDRNRRLVTTDLTTKTRKHCDDVIEVAEDDLIRDDTPDDEIMLIDDNTIKIISNIQIVPVSQKFTNLTKDQIIDRDQPSTSKRTDDNSDDEDNNSDVNMPTEEGNITSGDSNDDDNIADQNLDENICTEETIDDQQELVNSAKNHQKSEIDNQEILKLNDVISSKVVSNVDMTTTIEKHNNNKKHNSNSIQIIENIQIFPSKTLLVKFPFNENNETGIQNIPSCSSTDQKLVEEIVEKINEVNESFIEKNNIVQTEEIIKINELNENIENNIELPQVEKNTKNISDSLDEDLKENTENNDKEIEIRSIENESDKQTLNTETVDQQKLIENIPESSHEITNLSENILESSELSENIPDSSENILQSSENIPESSQEITNLSENILELSENIPESSEEKLELSVNIPETSENIIVESTENLTDNLPTTTNIQTKNYEEKSNESNENSPIYRESLLDIAIRDLITPFEPEKKLPSSKKSTKRGETQSIRKSSRKSDNIYKILGREITTPSPSPGNMATTNEIVVNQQTNRTITSSSIDDSSNSATEITIKSTGRGRRRSKKNLNQNVANEPEQIVVVEQTIDDDANSKNNNESIIENVIEHLSVADEKETKNDVEDVEKEEISSKNVVPKKTVGKTSKNEMLIQQQLSEEQPIIENVKSGRKTRRVKHQDDEGKSIEREEIPKIIIKSPPKNSNENPKIITKRSSSPGDKPIQENSPKKLKKLQLKSPVVVVNKSSINLISSTTNDIPPTTSSSTPIKSPPEEIVEAKQHEIQKSAISCFDFNEDDNEIILTPLNKLKKKYMSPPADKYKDEIDNNKMKETERKDQLLTAEIENILNNTKIPELKKIEIIAVAADKSNTTTKPSTSTFDTLTQITVPISTSIDINTQDIKGLPIKERGKRFFKSRNRPKTDENIITNVVPIDTTLKEIKSTNLNQDKKNTDISDSDINIEEIKIQNNDDIPITKIEETSIEIKNISQETENTIIKSATVQQNIESSGGLISNITSENELFIAETLLSFPNTVTTETTTSTLKNLENINVKLQNLKDDQQQQQIETNQITGNLIEQPPIQEKRTQIRVKSLEKLNQQFEDSLLQEKDIGKPTIEIVKPCILPLEHITRRRRSHLKITPRKRVLQQPVKLETNTTSNVVVEPNETIKIVKKDESHKSDETINYVPGESKIDETTVTTVVVSESMIISETNITDNKKIIEQTNLDTVQVVDKIDKDNLTITKTEESKTVTQQYEESFVEKYMKDSKLFDPSKEKAEKELNKNKNDEIIESPLEILNTEEKIINSVEPSQQLVVSSTENKNSKKSESDNEQNASSSSSSLSMKITPLTQSISDIRSFRPRRKTSNKRSPSFSSEYPSSRRSSIEYQVDIDSKVENVDRNVIDEPTTTRIATSSIQIPNTTITTIVSSTNINDKLDIIKPTDKLTTFTSNINVKFDTIKPPTDKLDAMKPPTDKLDTIKLVADKLDTIKLATDALDTLKQTTDLLNIVKPLTDIDNTIKPPADKLDTVKSLTDRSSTIVTPTDKLDTIKAPIDKLDIIKSQIDYIESIQPPTDNIDLIHPPTDKLIVYTMEEQQIHHHQLSPTIEKIQINVDLSNPLTTQIAKIFAAQNPLTNQPITLTDDITTLTPTILSKLGEEARLSSSAGTIKRKNTIEEEIPMFLIEKSIKCVTEQVDTENQSIQPSPEKIKKTTGIISSTTTTNTGGYGQKQIISNEESEVILSPINKTSSSQFSSTNKNTLGSGKLIITQLRDTTSSPGNKSADIKPDQSDISNIFDFTNMPIYIANESTLPFVVTTTASTTISPTVNSLPINTTASTAATTIVKRQGRGRPRKVLPITTITSTTSVTTLSTSIPKYTSTSQQTFNKPVSKNLSSYAQQQPVQQINSNTNNNYPIVHQTHTQQILDSQNYNLLQSANNSSTSAGKEVGIDSKGNRFILIKQGNSQKMVKQSPSNLPSSSSTDINKTKFIIDQTTTKPLQQSDLSNINVISSEVILPPTNPIKNQTTNLLIAKRVHQPEEELHQPEKKINLMGQQTGQFVITSKGDVIQSQNIKPITQACTTSQTLTIGKPAARRREIQIFKNESLGQQTHITGDSQQIIQQQQQQTTTTNLNHQQMFMESNFNIQQQQPPPLTKGKITTSQRGRKRKNENVMTCYNESQLEMPPLTAIQQNSPITNTDLKKMSQQIIQEQDTKKLKLLEKEQEIENIKKQLENEQSQISTTHSIDANVTNQLISDIDNLPSTSIQQCDDELQTNKIMAVPANHFGIPGNAYYLCSQSPDGDYLPIDSQKLYLDPDVNQLVPLTCLSKNTLATVLASEEAAEVAAAAQAQHQTAIILQTDDTDALIEETTEQSDIEEESKHNMEIQLIAAQQVAVVPAEEQQKIEKQQIIDNETTVLFDQTSNRQYIVEGGVGRGGGAVVEQITDNIVGATVGATVTASTDSIVDNIICLDIDENQQQIIAIDESDVISDISAGGGVNNAGIPAPVTSSAITPVAAENLLTAEDVSGFLASDQSIVINVDGQQLILDQQSFLALAATDGESAQLETAEGQTYILSREFLAALGIGGGGGVSSSSTGNIVNDDAQILLHDNSELSATNHDIIAAALAGTEVYYQQQQDDLMNLQIETSNGIVQQLVGEETLTFQHLTPPVTAETNETSALLTQPPIMSALEVPSNKKFNKPNKMYSNNKNPNELTIPDDDDDNIIDGSNNTNNRLLATSMPPQSLDDCIAFIGVSTQSSTIPSSLELPITITNPAIAPPKNSTNPIDTIFNTKGLGIPSTIGNIVGSSSSSSQISPHLITCNGEQELQYELFTTTQTTSQLKSTSNNSQNDDIFQTNFDDPTR